MGTLSPIDQLGKSSSKHQHWHFWRLPTKLKCNSKVRKHFILPANAHSEIMDNKKIVCRLCKVIIAYSGTHPIWLSTYSEPTCRNLWSYVSGDRPRPTVLPTVKQPSLKQQSLLGIVQRSIPFPQDSTKHRRLVDATADFICQGLLPLRVVDKSIFRRLLEIAQPWFHTAKTFGLL